MQIERIRALRGPNRWGRQTMIELELSDLPHAAAPDGCANSWQGLTPKSTPKSPNSWANSGEGLTPRLDIRAQPGEGLTPQGFARLALGLQAQAGCAVHHWHALPTRDPQTFLVAFEYSEEDVGRLALECAQELFQAALAGAACDVDAAVAKLRALDEDIRLGPSTGSIVQAAVRRGIPWRRLTQGSLVQFGWGKHQRRILAAETDASSAMAEAIAQDKQLTKLLLHAAGVPAPLGRPVQDADDAWEAARELGGAVVVKPRDGNQGKGVAVNLRTREEVQAAYAAARAIAQDVLVERYLPGQDHRLLVVNGKLVAAARRAPPQVRGDGQRSIRALVEELNRDPRRGDDHATALTKVRLDAIALATLSAQGYTADSVPAEGALVMLRNNANLSTGGSATDVTDEVHPAVAACAVDAAQAIGLDVCGVDLLCETVSRPLEEQSGGVVEVNAAPGLRMHLEPSFGHSRDVGEAIISAMFDDGENARVPLAAVTGTNGKTTTVRLIAQMFSASGKCVGFTGTDGVFVGGRQIDDGDCSGPKSARNVLMHPEVEAAVLETARGGMLREGLGFDFCDVAVVTNLGAGDHLGIGHIHTVEELAAIKRIIVENVAPGGYAVLNAADPLVAAMASVCPGQVIYFAQDKRQPVLAAHLAKGQRAVYRQGGALVAAENGKSVRVALAEIPVTHGGAIGFQVENAMAAMAAGWGLGLDWDDIRRGLREFVNSAQSVPGRFNLFQHRGANVIADYGHNPDAIAALVNAVQAMPGARRTVVISAAGDRRDEDIRRQTEILGRAFDRVILYEDQCQRGRADGEVLALLRQGLTGAIRTSEIVEVRGELKAINLALDALQSEDLCLILVDQVELALDHIARSIASAAQTELEGCA